MPTAALRPILAILFAGVLVGALDIAIVGPALPEIQTTFGVGTRALSWVYSSYVLFYVVGAPLLAKLSDRTGRRAVYAQSLALFAAGSLLVAAAPSFEILLLGRAIQAFGAGGIFPVASAVIAETVPAERRGRVLGLIGAVFGVAFLIGPLLGGVLLHWSWRWLFLINVPIGAVLIALGLRFLPSAAAAKPRRFDAARCSAARSLAGGRRVVLERARRREPAEQSRLRARLAEPAACRRRRPGVLECREARGRSGPAPGAVSLAAAARRRLYRARGGPRRGRHGLLAEDRRARLSASRRRPRA